jgi:hypothetical protein
MVGTFYSFMSACTPLAWKARQSLPLLVITLNSIEPNALRSSGPGVSFLAGEPMNWLLRDHAITLDVESGSSTIGRSIEIGQRMKEIFLSFHYDDGVNHRLAGQVEQLVESHGIRAVTGDVLGGNELTQEIKNQIAEADALVALLTRDQPMPNGDWTTFQYPLTELQHARGIAKPAMALVEDGVKVGGLLAANEFIPYKADAPLTAFLRLSRTIGRWRLEAGSATKVQITPNEVAQELWAVNEQCRWEYRLSKEDHETPWKPAKARREPSGLYVLVRVPDPTMLLEIRVTGPARNRSSVATPLATAVTPVALD